MKKEISGCLIIFGGFIFLILLGLFIDMSFFTQESQINAITISQNPTVQASPHFLWGYREGVADDKKYACKTEDGNIIVVDDTLNLPFIKNAKIKVMVYHTLLLKRKIYSFRGYKE